MLPGRELSRSPSVQIVVVTVLDIPVLINQQPSNPSILSQFMMYWITHISRAAARFIESLQDLSPGQSKPSRVSISTPG